MDIYLCAKYREMERERYIIQRNSTKPDGWVLTDTKYGIVVLLDDGKLNETQRITFLDDVPRPDAVKLAKVMREMGEWAVRHHSSKCLSNVYGIEYSEDDSQLYLYRRDTPRWRMLLQDRASVDALAKSLKDAADFLTSTSGGHAH